jgi:hypothetical protein
LAFPHFKVHEGFAKESRRPEPRLGHPSGIAVEHLRLQQIVEKGEYNPVEDLVYLFRIRFVKQDMRAQQHSLQLANRGMANLASSIGGLSAQRAYQRQAHLSPGCEYSQGGSDKSQI